MAAPTPDWPRITVVTPSFNQGRFLAQCIGSVLTQDYPNLEYFILDGGSTDESVRVIQAHQDRIDYWVSEPDGGQSAAINAGFRRATGTLVAWLNADDFYAPDALRTVAEAYRQRPGASFYFGDGWRVDEAGKPISRFVPEGPVVFNHDALVYGLNYILQPATFIDRAALERAGYLDAKLRYGMDSDLWLRLARHGAPQPVQAPLAASREYGTTKTASGSFPRAEELRQISAAYSGAALTPGAILYYLDTMHRAARERPDVFPEEYLREIEGLWQGTSRLLATYGAGPDGFPRAAAGPIAPVCEGAHARLARAEADLAARLDVIQRLSALLTAAQQEVTALHGLRPPAPRPLPVRALRAVRRWARRLRARVAAR